MSLISSKGGSVFCHPLRDLEGLALDIGLIQDKVKAWFVEQAEKSKRLQEMAWHSVKVTGQ